MSTPNPSAPAADAMITASLLDALVIDEISLVPGGGNQHADIIARKADADAATADATQGFLGGLKRAMHAVLAKIAPDAASDDATHTEMNAGLAEAATALLVLQPGAPVEKGALCAGKCSPRCAACTKKYDDDAAEVAAVAKAAAAAAAGTPAVPLVPVAASGQESPPMSTEAAVTTTPAEVQKQIDAAVAAQVAKADALEKQNEALSTRLTLLEKSEKDAVLKSQFATIFGDIPVSAEHAPAVMTLLAKADETERAALTALTTFTRTVQKDAQLFASVGTSRTVAKASGAAAELEAIAKAAQTATGRTFHECYAKALDEHPALAARVMAEDRPGVSA